MKDYLLFFCFISTLSFAQPENPLIEEIDGKKYYVHIVQGGNTLWGLSQVYNTDAATIINSNPGSENGIQIGQKLLIPFVENKNTIETKKEPQTTLVDAPEIHIVKKGDNLYNISKRYHVTMEEIIKLNPGSEVSIAIDQELKLPKSAKIEREIDGQELKYNTTVEFKDSLIYYTVLPQETLYTISKRFMVSQDEIKRLNNMRNDRLRKNDVIKIPVKKEKVTKIEIRKVEEIKDPKIDKQLAFKPKSDYKIALFLPFNLDESNEQLRGIATEFYMGAELALDSLEKMGLKAKVLVFDVDGDTSSFKNLLVKEKINQVDLIIGPFMGNVVAIAANFAKQNKIRMISPLNSNPELIQENEFVYNAVNSDITQIEAAAKYLARTNGYDQFLLIKATGKDKALYDAFKIAYKANGGNTKLIETSIDDYPMFLKKGTHTFVIAPFTDKVLSVKMMNSLSKNVSKVGSAKLHLFGTKDWLNFDDVKGYYKNKFNLHFASPYDFNYSYVNTKKMLTLYRKKFNADLSKYGTQGFDVTLHAIMHILMQKNCKEQVMNNIQYVKAGDNHGYENQNCFILKHEDFQIINLTKSYE